MKRSLAIALNAAALYAIAAILLAAFYFQLVLDELPCPLCLLQRIAFVALAFGPVLTVRYGPRPFHYGLIILAALCGATVAGRQILLHILPGDPGYGSALLGYHYYTWAFIVFAAAIAAAAAMLLFDRQFDRTVDLRSAPYAPGLFATAAVWLMIAVTLLNAAGVVVECGFASCADNPVVYEMLQKPA